MGWLESGKAHSLARELQGDAGSGKAVGPGDQETGKTLQGYEPPSPQPQSQHPPLTALYVYLSLPLVSPPHPHCLCLLVTPYPQAPLSSSLSLLLFRSLSPFSLALEPSAVHLLQWSRLGSLFSCRAQQGLGPQACPPGLPISAVLIVWTNSFPVSSVETTWVDVFKRNSLGSKWKTHPNKAAHHLETALVSKAKPSATAALGLGLRDTLLGLGVVCLALPQLSWVQPVYPRQTWSQSLL